MKSIKLTQGKITLVSDEDFDLLKSHNWFYHKSNHNGNGGYAERNVYVNGKQVSLKMHRVILNAQNNFEVDHINSDKLDNRRENLRLAKKGENQKNVGKRKNNTSGFKGINWHCNKWRARININNQSIYLGHFETKQKAFYWYCLAANIIHQEFANTL